MPSELNHGNSAAPAVVQRNRRFWRRLLGAFVVFLVGIALLVHFLAKKNKPAHASGPPPMPVVTATAKTGDLPIYLNAIGSATALNSVTLRTRVDGQLFNIAVREGQMVNMGELIAEIDPRPFQVQLLQAQGQKERDEAILANAKVDLERYRVLYAQNAVPRQQFDTQASTVNQYEAIVKADEGAIENARLQLTYAHITSPIRGRIGLRLVDPGNIVHASDQNGLAVITQLQPIAVIFTLPEDSLPAVNGRMRSGATLQVKALSRGDGTEVASGSLLSIYNQIDQTTGTFRLKAVFDNKDRALWPNQFVNARLLIDVKKNATIIPVAAVQRGDQGTFVYRVKPSDNTAEVVPVTLGVTEGILASIQNGISPNDLVVTDGQDRLRAGVRVEPRPDTRSNATTNPANPHTDNPAPQSFPASPRPQFQPPAGSQSLAAPNAQDNQPNRQSDNSQGYRTGNRNRPSRQQ